MDRTDGDLGWIAGFFDGEGHVSYQRSRPSEKSSKISPMLSATITQHVDNVEVLEFFQSIVGFGKILGPYQSETNGTITRRFDLKYGKNEVEPLYFILMKYLKSKKKEDFIRAISSFNNHNPNITPDDVARLANLGCTKCKEEWNGLVCAKCGYIA